MSEMRLWSAFFAGTNSLFSLYYCFTGETTECVIFGLCAAFCVVGAFVDRDDLHEPGKPKPRE